MKRLDSHLKPSLKSSNLAAFTAPEATNTQDTNANQLLLSQHSFRNNVEVNGMQVILSVEPSLELGGNNDSSISSSYSGRVAIFAEGATLTDNFKAEEAYIALHKITVASGKVFDFSGAPGINSDMPLPSDGSGSHDGGNGGKLFLSLEDIGNTITKDELPEFDANGGNGGTGKIKTIDGTVGNGGNGGNGGNITFYAVSSYQKALDDIDHVISSINANKNINDVIQETKDTIKDSAQEVVGYFNDVNNLFNNSVSSEVVDINILKSKLQNTKVTIDYYLTDYQNRQKGLMNVDSGEGGICDISNASGKPGVHGNVGSIDLVIKGTINDLFSSLEQKSDMNFLPVHPAQCSMLLNQIKLKYILLDTNDKQNFISQSSDMIVMLNRLLDRTKAFVDLKEDTPLYKLYTQNEQKFGSYNSIISLANIHREADGYLKQFNAGLDFFGYQDNYVPLIGLGQLQNSMKTLINGFETIESSYVTYLQELKDTKMSVDRIALLKNSIKNEQDKVTANIADLWHTLSSSASDIESYKSRLESKKQVVQDELTKYKGIIEGYFNFDLNQLLDAASTIAFAPSEPAMWITQGVKTLYSASTEITNIEGQPVNKDYIVHQVSKIGDSLKDISEGYKVGDDDTIVLEDPGANKLMADENTLNSLLDEFYNKFSEAAKVLKDDMQEYINLAISRNNSVMKYNSCISLLQQNYASQEANSSKLSSLDNNSLETTNADLPYLSAFSLDAYRLAQNNIAHITDIAARAYKLWTLDNKNICTISNADGSLPSALDYTTLSTLYDNFYSQSVFETIKNQPNMHTSFTAKSNPGETGNVLFALGANDGRKEGLKYGVTFTITPQEKYATGSFDDMAAVRVSEVRVYLKNAKLAQGHENEEINVNITHVASDKFVDQNNRIHSFSYDKPISMPFHYDATQPSNISVPASFRISNTSDNESPGQPVLSPFTDWIITVDSNHNPHLDYSSITGVAFEFDGICSGFN